MEKTIIITGANRGIGAACSRLFLRKNYRVALLSRNMDQLTQISSEYKNAFPLKCDIEHENDVIEAFNKVVKKWGRLDILFNNAGISLPETRIDKIKASDWQKLINVNLNGSFICAREAFKIMMKQVPQGGRIINNGSISSKVPRYGTAAYTSSKHAISGLTKAIALDGREVNIACSQIDIGNANTEMVKAINEQSTKPKEPTIDVQHVASSVFHIAEMPVDTNVQFMTILANKMPFIGRG